MIKIRLQLADHIGYHKYNEVFLRPLEIIEKADLPNDSKRRYCKFYIDQLVHYLGSSLLHDEDGTCLIWSGLDFEADNTYFSEIFYFALEQAVMVFYEVLEKYRLGGWVDGKFITDYYLQSIDIMSGNMVVIDTRDTCTP